MVVEHGLSDADLSHHDVGSLPPPEAQSVLTAHGHSPVLATTTPLYEAQPALEWVTPSQPQTGSQLKLQMVDLGVQTPSVFASHRFEPVFKQ